MIRSLLILILIFSMAGCSQKDAVPRNVLKPAKMQAVLWDVLRADEMAGYYTQKDSSLNALKEHVDFYQEVFQIHKISKDDFKKSLQFYEGRPDLLKIIFDSLQKQSERSLKVPPPVK